MKNITIRFTVALACLWLMGCSQQKFGVLDNDTSFNQTPTYNNKVDILWVVDDSTSMSPFQQKIAQEVPNFVSALKATGMDFHMGVTSMDCSSTGEKGRLVAAAGTPLVLTNSTPNLVSILQQRLQMGEMGSSVERGLEATSDALTEPTASSSNAGFRRLNSDGTGAVLAVIYVSNEDDQSGSAVSDPVAFFDSQSVQTYGEPQWVVSYIGTTPDDPTCKTVPWGTEYGLTYISLANHSGGAAESICNGNFATALTNVKGHILTMMTEYHFAFTPVESSIVVKVNGQLIPNDPNNGWTYISSRNVIQFHGSAIPPVGARVDVSANKDISQ